TVDHIATLRGMYSALKNGEATVEEMFVGTVKAISDHQQISDPLSDEPAISHRADDAEKASKELSKKISEQDTSAETTPSGSVEGGEPVVDQASTLDNSDEPEVAEINYELRNECWDKFLQIVTEESQTLQERRGILETSKD